MNFARRMSKRAHQLSHKHNNHARSVLIYASDFQLKKGRKYVKNFVASESGIATFEKTK